MTFTPDSLADAVGKLLILNNYAVQNHVKIAGAEVDIVAVSKYDPFSAKLYIEVTTEYVRNDKYGKDTTKFLIVKNIDPSATCICISSSGFTADVIERAHASRIQLFTYDDFFRKFEQFKEYIDYVLNDPSETSFRSTYEEPSFSDAHGEDNAPQWLFSWAIARDLDARWLIILGEYGTGKTALSKILQYKLLMHHVFNPDMPIPIRIELRDFSRQFDSRSLLHHFLDSNRLSHISVDFLFKLIRTGRIFLILDGYDEMAQFLNPRERRACLSALAQLSSDGARGFLTSRPNYFSETEELNVFEVLYRTVKDNDYRIGHGDYNYLNAERDLDELISTYILSRYERSLRDLTPLQTRSLIERKLVDDVEGQRVVIGILDRIFTPTADGGMTSLSGKPVIISYLLELVDDLKKNPDLTSRSLTEFSVYKMIVDRLMFRDQERTPGILPAQRRKCLQELAISISKKGEPLATEETFLTIINREFARELKTLDSAESYTRRHMLFEHLRISSTLTRSEERGVVSYKFSHNSLREYLCVEYYLHLLAKNGPSDISIPITSAMLIFARSVDDKLYELCVRAIEIAWVNRINTPSLGKYISLLWGAAQLRHGNRGPINFLRNLSGDRIDLSDVRLSGVSFSSDFSEALQDCIFACSELEEVMFIDSQFRRANFRCSYMDSVVFENCDLSSSDLSDSYCVDITFIKCQLNGLNFRGVNKDATIRIKGKDTDLRASGLNAIGYLRWCGGTTDDIDPMYVAKWDPRYAIATKICEKLLEQRNRQYLGLTQKGDSQMDPPFAKRFVDHLKNIQFVNINRNDLVSLTSTGRSEIQDFVNQKSLGHNIVDFFRRERFRL